MSRFTQEQVDAALDRAMFNDPESFVGLTTTQVAVDLCTYDSDFELEDLDELPGVEELVRDWQARQ